MTGVLLFSFLQFWASFSFLFFLQNPVRFQVLLEAAGRKFKERIVRENLMKMCEISRVSSAVFQCLLEIRLFIYMETCQFSSFWNSDGNKMNWLKLKRDSLEMRAEDEDEDEDAAVVFLPVSDCDIRDATFIQMLSCFVCCHTHHPMSCLWVM